MKYLLFDLEKTVFNIDNSEILLIAFEILDENLKLEKQIQYKITPSLLANRIDAINCDLDDFDFDNRNSFANYYQNIKNILNDNYIILTTEAKDKLFLLNNVADIFGLDLLDFCCYDLGSLIFSNEDEKYLYREDLLPDLDLLRSKLEALCIGANKALNLILNSNIFPLYNSKEVYTTITNERKIKKQKISFDWDEAYKIYNDLANRPYYESSENVWIFYPLRRDLDSMKILDKYILNNNLNIVKNIQEAHKIFFANKDQFNKYKECYNFLETVEIIFIDKIKNIYSNLG